jgi:hypothetical protein
MAQRTNRSDVWIVVMAAMLALAFYFGAAMGPSAHWFSRQPLDYYGFQTAGFRAGHLYAAVQPHPGLLALKDPYDPGTNGPYRMNDMTLYGGHYYLYFGVSPILIAFWPLVALTGWYPAESFVVASFCTGSIWIGLILILALRRKYFEKASPVALILGALCFVLANPLSRLVEHPQFYQVAISGAVFLQMAMVAAVYCSLHSERRGPGWLALASLLYGLDVGARPSYLPGAIALLVVAVALARRAPAGFRASRLRQTLAAAGIPAVACGVGLMMYNWLRFGSVVEFGMRYQLAGLKQFDFKFFDLRNIAPHLAHFLFGPGFWSVRFPFFFGVPSEPHGFLRYTLWAWLAPLALLRAGSLGAGAERRIAFVLATLAAALGNLLLLVSFMGTNDEYGCDYTCIWLLASCTGALALSQRAGLSRGRTGTDLLLGALAIVSIFTSLAVFASYAPPHLPLLALGRAANWPRYVWRREHGREDGALKIAVTLASGRTDGTDPIMETGRGDQTRDWLELEYLPENRARAVFCHAGMPGFLGDSFVVPADRRLLIEVLCGSLLPPFDDPAFVGWTRDEFDAARRDLWVRVNGVQRLRAIMDCYASSPGDLTLGRLKWPADGTARQFSGEITSVERLPLLPPKAIPFKLHQTKPVEMDLYLPVQHGSGGEPLLVTGSGAQSDLLYCVYDGHSRIRFALDHNDTGGPKSEFVPFDGPRSHRVTIWMGSLARPRGSNPAARMPGDAGEIPWSRRLVVTFDGQTMLNLEQSFHGGPPATALFGVNSFGSSTADRIFTGRIDQVRQVEFSDLPTLKASGGYGGVVLTVRFPSDAFGAHEPLVVTGSSGEGDLLYASYVDARHIAIGFDHWGTRGLLGAPIEIDYAKPHRLTLTMDSLYPPGTLWASGGLVQVKVDGQLALGGRSPCFPSPSSEIRIGENPIGGSTCGPRFTGKVLATERTSEPPR